MPNKTVQMGRWQDDILEYVKQAVRLEKRNVADVAKERLMVWATHVHKKHKTGKCPPKKK